MLKRIANVVNSTVKAVRGPPQPVHPQTATDISEGIPVEVKQPGKPLGESEQTRMRKNALVLMQQQGTLPPNPLPDIEFDKSHLFRAPKGEEVVESENMKLKRLAQENIPHEPLRSPCGDLVPWPDNPAELRKYSQQQIRDLIGFQDASGTKVGVFSLFKKLEQHHLTGAIDHFTVLRFFDSLTHDERQKIAGDQYIYQPFLSIFATHSATVVRATAAGNPAASENPDNILSKLADDREWAVRMSVAGNPESNEALQRKLARDAHWLVRAAAAFNSVTDPSTLTQLTGDPSSHVRVALARNRATPDGALKYLARNQNLTVRAMVSLNNGANPDLREALAKVPAIITVRRMCINSQDTSVTVRAQLAQSETTPAELLPLLAGDWSAQVRAAVYHNPLTPPEIRELMAARLSATPQLNTRVYNLHMASVEAEYARMARARAEINRVWDALPVHGHKLTLAEQQHLEWDRSGG